jgi:hypothetical protein
MVRFFSLNSNLHRLRRIISSTSKETPLCYFTRRYVKGIMRFSLRWLWRDITPFGTLKLRFGGAYRLHLQSWRIRQARDRHWFMLISCLAYNRNGAVPCFPTDSQSHWSFYCNQLYRNPDVWLQGCVDSPRRFYVSSCHLQLTTTITATPGLDFYCLSSVSVIVSSDSLWTAFVLLISLCSSFWRTLISSVYWLCCLLLCFVNYSCSLSWPALYLIVTEPVLIRSVTFILFWGSYYNLF